MRPFHDESNIFRNNDSLLRHVLILTKLLGANWPFPQNNVNSKRLQITSMFFFWNTKCFPSIMAWFRFLLRQDSLDCGQVAGSLPACLTALLIIFPTFWEVLAARAVCSCLIYTTVTSRPSLAQNKSGHILSLLALAGAWFCCAVSPAADRTRKGPVTSRGVRYIDKTCQ